VGAAFLWGLLGASSLVLGVVVVTFRRPRPHALGLTMAFGAGVLLSAASYELVEEAVDTAGGLRGTTLGLFTGCIVFTLADAGISAFGYRNRKDIDAAPQEAAGPAIVLGALLDGVPESAVLGLTLLQAGEIGVAMLVAVFVSNIPESIAASASLLNSGWSLARLYVLWAAIAIASALAAGIGYAMLDGASPRTLAFILAFAGGAILTMLATSMMPEAYEHAGRAVGIVTVLGFFLAFAIHWAQA
jgi:zinc transporter, ZIP family